MTFKRLGAADLAAAVPTVLYTVPALKESVINVNLCNRSGAAIAVRVALSTTSSPSASEYIEYDASLAANGVLERTGIALEAGMNIVVQAAAANVSAVAWGDEAVS